MTNQETRKHGKRHRILGYTKQSLSETLPSGYLTVLGIIQAVALGVLAERTFDRSLTHGMPLVHWLPYSLLSFSFIGAVTYTYAWAAGVIKWMPDVADTFGPLAIGFSEVGPLFFLAQPSMWWPLTGLCCLICAGVHMYAMHRTRDMVVPSASNVERLTRLQFRDCAAVLLAGFALCAEATWVTHFRLPDWCLWPYVILFMIGLIAYFKRGERFKKELCEDDLRNAVEDTEIVNAT